MRLLKLITWHTAAWKYFFMSLVYFGFIWYGGVPKKSTYSSCNYAAFSNILVSSTVLWVSNDFAPNMTLNPVSKMWLTYKSHTFLLYGYSPMVAFIFTVCKIERSQIQTLPLLFPADFGFSFSVLVSFPHNLTDHSEKGQKFYLWYSLWFISTQTKVHLTHTTYIATADTHDFDVS